MGGLIRVNRLQRLAVADGNPDGDLLPSVQ